MKVFTSIKKKLICIFSGIKKEVTSDDTNSKWICGICLKVARVLSINPNTVRIVYGILCLSEHRFALLYISVLVPLLLKKMVDDIHIKY